ncbi:MAG: sigma 54-interacting transcriptional regulator, partial [Deltaproteobacteria bacterium]|nr:sigma 54-interacting transcriptional regulator [Deltaproteobacteria bacterium]
RYFMREGIRSNVLIPLAVGGSFLGVIGFASFHSERGWSEGLIQRLTLIGQVFANALMRKRKELELNEALSEIRQLKDRLEAENVYLREECWSESDHNEIIGKSDAVRRILGIARQVAGTDSTVLIEGETGTGKELLAREIHKLSPRGERAMVKINCAALPPNLVESELFGREKGAYTGASSKQIGRFEFAHGSTILLDEISELPIELQSKLLRVLQDGEFERLGNPRTIRVDVRVIAATNRELAGAVRDGKFREDLYYRLKVFPILIPPLRERREDIPLLVWFFVKAIGSTMGKTIRQIPRSKMDALQDYPWPGNVRELKNVIERAIILTEGPILRLDFPKIGDIPPHSVTKLRDVEKRHILNVLKMTGWRIRGRNGAAEILDLIPTTLDSRLKRLGIQRPSRNTKYRRPYELS